MPEKASITPSFEGKVHKHWKHKGLWSRESDYLSDTALTWPNLARDSTMSSSSKKKAKRVKIPAEQGKSEKAKKKSTSKKTNRVRTVYEI